MKIFEIMILEDEEGLFTKFSRGIPMKILKANDFPVYRLEIDRSLVLIFYLFEIQKRPPAHLLENIFPSLKRIIWLSSQRQFMNLTPPAEYNELFEQFEDLIPSAVILDVGDDSQTDLAEALLHHGCYLGDQSRLYLWNAADPQNSRQIWQLIWSVHETPMEVATISEMP